MLLLSGPSPQPQMVKKFYFVEYFYILLKSAEHYSYKELVFENFKTLKDKFQLGESKYRKLTKDDEDLSESQLSRYRYTFDQVIGEAVDYGLIKERGDEISIRDFGYKALKEFESGRPEFNRYILALMERKYFAFFHLIHLCYNSNKRKQGLLILPVYSPPKLGFKKEDFKTIKNVHKYIEELTSKLESDVKTYMSKKISLLPAEKILIDELIKEGHLPNNISVKNTDQRNYNSLIKRIRTFWLNYFLKSIYGYTFSFDTFNIWAERGKQLGVLHSTEFYPGIDGRVVYPTSIITSEKVGNKDFIKVFQYENLEALYIHSPRWKTERNRELFVSTLVDSYFDLKKVRGNLFINLSDLKEKVCYKMRIPGYIFDEFLQETYFLNLKGELHIQISLEADRLPHETNAIYLKREPVLVNGKYKNIIAIDYKNEKLTR